MRLIISIALVDSMLGAVADPCTALDHRSFCMDNGYCFGLLSDVDDLSVDEMREKSQSPLSCTDAYTEGRFTTFTIREEPPIIKSVNAREMAQLLKCESGDFNFQSVLPLLQNPDHAHLFNDMLRTLTTLHDRMRKMFPHILYDSMVDGETLRQFVSGARDISSQVFAPLIRERDRDTVEAFQCAIVRSDFGKSLRAYLDLYSREIQTNNEPRVSMTILANISPFVHAWLTVNAHLGINLPLWRTQDLGLITTISRLDPMYPLTEDEKNWMVPIAEPTLKSSPTSNVLPTLLLPQDEFPLTVLDTLSFPDDGIAEAGNHLADSVLLFHREHESVPFEYLRSAMFFLRHHQSVNEMDIANFCTQLESLMLSVLDDLVHGELNAQNLFGAHGITEYLNLCGSSGFSFDQRVSHLLPVFLGERSRTGAPVYTYEANGPFSLFRALKFISDLPIHALQGAVVIVPSKKSSNDLIGRRTSRKRARDASGATISDIGTYHSWISKVAKSTIAALFVESPAIVKFAHTADSQMTEMLRAFGRAIALLFVEGDPENVLTSYLASRPDLDIYFNSVSVRNGFCEVLPCNVLDLLIGRDEIASALDTIRGVELLTRSFAATEIDPEDVLQPRRMPSNLLAIQDL